MKNLKFGSLSYCALAAVLLPSLPALAREDVSGGGAILKELFNTCKIVGIGTSNAGARYALRKVRQKDIVSSDYDTLVIRNLDDGEKSFGGRPKYISLTLRQVDFGQNGEIERYYIKGAFSSSPSDSATTYIGTLSEISFSLNDTMPIDVNNKYGFRGVLSTASIDLQDSTSVRNIGISGGWDLALPGAFNKEALCDSRETSDRDGLFIR